MRVPNYSLRTFARSPYGCWRAVARNSSTIAAFHVHSDGAADHAGRNGALGWALGVISVSSYRFCRTDDIGLLVDALNRCWAPYFPDEPPVTPAAFKRSIRDLQVWCSSCMVVFVGPDPIGVLIGAKRPSGTLIHKIAVHPDHRRQGHGRHLLTSLSSKLAILGPPRIVAEVPEALAPACELFSACGYVHEAVLTDYVLGIRDSRAEPDCRAGSSDPANREVAGVFVIPVTVADLAANGLLEEGDRPVCWQRSTETLTPRKDDIAGLAVASEERIEAYVLYANDGEIVSLRSVVEDSGVRLTALLSQLRGRGLTTWRLAKVHPAEISQELLEALGFRPSGRHRLYAARARSD
jgi:GNAT superfamily N-acetyltransferase